MDLENTRSIGKPRINNAALRLAILCMGFYAISYICRKSFDSNINEIMDYYGKTKSTVGLIGTFFFIAYAVGQVVHGIMCKYYKPRPMIFTMGLVVAGMNLLMGIVPQSGFKFLKFIWLVNGFACASFWSLLILTLNRCTAKKHKHLVMIVACFPVSTGTFLSYGISALLSFLNQFRYSFYIGCGAMVAACFVWLVRSKPLMDACLEERALCDIEETVAASADQKKSSWSKAFIISFVFLALHSIVNNLIKDGVSTWTPTILKETYSMENWVAVLLSVLNPLMSVFGGFISMRLYRKLHGCVLLNSILYAFTGAVLGILFVTFRFNLWFVTMGCLIFVSLMMSAVNNTNTSIFPLNTENVNAGTIAGVIDGFCYVGSALSSYCVGALAEKAQNWNVVFALYLILAVVCVLSTFLYLALERKHGNTTDTNA